MNLILLLADSPPATAPSVSVAQYLPSALSFMVGGALTWIVTFLRLRGEIQKLKAEITTEQGKTLEKIQHFRGLSIASTSKFGGFVKKFLEVLKSSGASNDERQRARDNLCASLSDSVIPDFHNYIEWEHLDKKSDPDELKVIVEAYVIPELTRFDKWIKIINHDAFTVKMGFSPYVVGIGTVQPFLTVLSGLKSGDKSTLQPILSRLITSMRGGNTSPT